ncbi:MAG TPA: phosphotransferase [Bacillales bacterium]|nr:phosphotransferase [Bacillales bacterium]
MNKMEKKAQEAFSDCILQESMKRYGIEEGQIRKLGGFESFVYEYEKGGKDYVLRISHSSHRSLDQIKGEIEWVNHLASNQVSVSKAVPSKENQFVETIPADDNHFSVVSFEKAPGRPPGKEDWNDDLFRQMGRMTGKMHALAKEFQPEYRRPEWDEEMKAFGEKFLDFAEPTVAKQFQELQEYPREFSKDPSEYGLIHADFHRGNFFVEEGTITLFDFDDSQYSWLVEDIAMALFYAISPDCRNHEDLAFARHFYDCYMEGYHRENTLASKWLQEIPYFLKRREVDVYLAVKGSIPNYKELTGWAGEFMKDRQSKIEHDLPYVDILF